MLAFLLSVVAISLSGVMLPGPLTAATIAKGYRDKNAGFYIALGHIIVELPIILLVYFGFADYFTIPEVKMITGILGGLMLGFMGAMVFRTLNKSNSTIADIPYNSLVTGIIMTAANPYFLLWWMTIGIAFVASAVHFGLLGLILLGLVHWTCDTMWEIFVSMSVFKTRHLWTPKAQRIVFTICALVLIGFGIQYCCSAIIGAL
ncbi:MAG TPA: lysine transporter LysE [Dehalococcoidia bacterium]|nr:lysine transporter LysE [Dehalococcoidia bacterium]